MSSDGDYKVFVYIYKSIMSDVIGHIYKLADMLEDRTENKT